MSKKTKNKSVNVNNLDKNEKSKTTKDSSKFKIVFGVFSKIISYLFVVKALFTIYGIYLVYVSLTNVPDLPKVDVNVRWGVDNNTHDTRIRPYRVIFSDAMESEIRALFEDYRLMERKIKSFKNTAWTYGVHSDAFAQFFSHWIFKYKFRERVKFLNKYDHFLTNIQGLDIHFVHVKPKADKDVKVVPLLLLHGWPGSVREFYEAIPLLTTPRPDYDFVFEVIAPSLPGFVFSEAPTRPGLDTYEMAIIMRNLMRRLGYTQYYIQGGDFGHMIGSHIATIFPSEVLGFHTNFPANTSKLSLLTWLLGGLLWPSYFGNGIEDRMYPLKDKLEFYLEETGYSHLQSTKPDTIGIVLTDSPVALGSYILDRFMIFTNHTNKFEDEGGIDKYYDFDKLLDNIMLYWVSGSITTSLRIYKETFAGSRLNNLAQVPTSVPTWALRLKYELFQHPDYMLRWKYTNLLGSTNLDYGGHFAAFERPKDFSDDVFKAVKAFRNFK
ncbi:juvenile hormone epoxide hydrolase-like [Bombyx mandarina]|uniref:microsomal epoxide hydrolase n=1 Tax=Bombyx mandarina TaxID=7092 RepID=A0A6J2JQF1_BOMMA|nr:juvenile hormone epoxide hydrolase-like [Bombyx mandarina]